MKPRRTRAFTLIELMTVVIIVGVLAAIALVGTRKLILASKTNEAVAMVGSIKVAQEEYRSETGHFADLGIDPRCPVTPSSLPKPHKAAWNGACAGSSGRLWSILPVRVDGPVMYSYGTTSGMAGEAVATKAGAITIDGQPITFLNPTKEWYVVLARGDVNGDGVESSVMGSSFTTELAVDKLGE